MNGRLLSLALLIGTFHLTIKAVAAAPVIELFTSQGCYSCPAADKFLGEIITDRPEVVALEFHVDYWDDLHYGSAGVWKDPFSDPSFTARQRQYNNRQLQGRPGVYTPQMIVNGHTAQVGSSRQAVIEALRQMQPPVNVSASRSGTEVTIETSPEANREASSEASPAEIGNSGATIWLAVFDRKHETEVLNGENHGKKMLNHHVVRQLTPLSRWRQEGFTKTITIPALSDSNAGCAILIQAENQGEMLAANYCDSDAIQGN